MPQTITNFYAVTGGKLLLEDGKTVDPLDSPAAAAEVPRELKATLRRLHRQPEHPAAEPQPDVQAPEGIHPARRSGPTPKAMVVTYNRSLKVKRRFTSEARATFSERSSRPSSRPAAGRRSSGERTRHPLAHQRCARPTTEAIRCRAHVLAVAAQRPRVHRRRDQDDARTASPGRGAQDLPLRVGGSARPRRDTSSSTRSRRSSRTDAATLRDVRLRHEHQVRSIVQAANANGVTICALDASGLRRPTSWSRPRTGT